MEQVHARGGEEEAERRVDQPHVDAPVGRESRTEELGVAVDVREVEVVWVLAAGEGQRRLAAEVHHVDPRVRRGHQHPGRRGPEHRDDGREGGPAEERALQDDARGEDGDRRQRRGEGRGQDPVRRQVREQVLPRWPGDEQHQLHQDPHREDALDASGVVRVAAGEGRDHRRPGQEQERDAAWAEVPVARPEHDSREDGGDRQPPARGEGDPQRPARSGERAIVGRGRGELHAVALRRRHQSSAAGRKSTAASRHATSPRTAVTPRLRTP